MFDIGFSELVLIALVALVVLGPERLPKAARLAGMWLRKARTHWNAVKDELERELASEELKRSLKQAQDAAAHLQAEVENARRGLDQQVRQAASDVAGTVATATTAAASTGDDAPRRMPGSPFTEQELRDAGFLDDEPTALPLAEAAPVAAAPLPAAGAATHEHVAAERTHATAEIPAHTDADAVEADAVQSSLPFADPRPPRGPR